MTLHTLDTPAALIDQGRLHRNIARMQQQLDGLGVAFRPHVKTSKCVPVATLQRDAGARGITVSTLKEAEAFFAAGFDDILYAVGLVAPKIERALALHQQGCRLQVIVDSVDAARAVAQAAPALPVLIEIDVDGHRSGVDPASDTLLAIGRAVHDGGGTLHGVMTHAGSSYDLRTPAALQALAEQERALCVLAATRLREAGLPCPVVSIGSTPTALSARRLDGVTEVRAGVYVFFDLVMAGVGVCSPDDIALSVLCTVIGHQREKGWALVDAGWMAMSRDRGTQSHALDCGYGLVCDETGSRIPGLQLVGANQEHGIVGLVDSSVGSPADGPAPGDLALRLPLGTHLRILPNHACATGAQHDHYHLVEGTQLLQTWPRLNGW
jgi:threo-3-hydroxy-D-aspartate ammonia-lyase